MNKRKRSIVNDYQRRESLTIERSSKNGTSTTS